MSGCRKHWNCGWNNLTVVWDGADVIFCVTGPSYFHLMIPACEKIWTHFFSSRRRGRNFRNRFNEKWNTLSTATTPQISDVSRQVTIRSIVANLMTTVFSQMFLQNADAIEHCPLCLIWGLKRPHCNYWPQEALWKELWWLTRSCWLSITCELKGQHQRSSWTASWHHVYKIPRRHDGGSASAAVCLLVVAKGGSLNFCRKMSECLFECCLFWSVS